MGGVLRKRCKVTGMVEEPRQPNSNSGRSWLITVFLIGLGVLGVAILLLGLWAFVGPSTTTQRQDFLQAAGGFLVGLAAIVGLYFQWKNSRIPARAQQESTQAPQEGTQTESVEVKEQDKVSDRFHVAVDQLEATDSAGRNRLGARLAAIEALEGVAEESEEYYWPVMEILTAYVQQHAYVREHTKDAVFTEEFYKRDKATPDIQMIMDVIRRRTRSVGNGEPKLLRLRGVDMRQVDLSGP